MYAKMYFGPLIYYLNDSQRPSTAVPVRTITKNSLQCGKYLTIREDNFLLDCRNV